ncbi:MAG: MBL fold metallo-hydrolase [Planctomycetaceae bacterium]|nr:MBL fold metallo-hydrolase [Planctomycetaceae bacterium]
MNHNRRFFAGSRLRPFVIVFSAVLFLRTIATVSAAAADAGEFRQPDPQRFPQLFQWSDTCNVYVLRDGDSAVLINLGNGSILNRLSDIGVSRIDWVLFTDHHREVCQGVEQLKSRPTQIAVPSAEQELFTTPAEFRKWNPKLGDRFSVYGASYVRPPRLPVSVARSLEADTDFIWHDYRLRCLATPGTSPGGMTFLLTADGKKAAFSGALLHSGAKMSNWFDTEWDYGFGKGIDTLTESVAALLEQKPDLILPSHGPVIRDAQPQLREYGRRLTKFRENYVRGYPVFDKTEAKRDPISQPTKVPLLNQVSPHLFKLNHTMQGRNFAIIISDNGHGLVLDCGLFPEQTLEELIVGMREHLGLKQIDAVWISHMHGDHFLLGRVLREKHGAQAWTLDRIVDRCEHPRRYDYAALINTYGDGFDGMKIDRPIRDGEVIDWEGYQIHVDWMPGQTEFGCCLWLELDGQRVAFTGDNLFGSPADPGQTGHECVVARNSGIFEEGYLYAGRYLQKLKPDLLMGGHSYVMPQPEGFINRYTDWAQEMIAIYTELLPGPDYEYGFDPYWVSAYPYRIDFSETTEQTVQITVRNFRDAEQQHRIELALPDGLRAEPSILEGSVPPNARRTFPVKLSADTTALSAGIHIVPFDITLNDRPLGQLFDFLVSRGSAPDNAATTNAR